MLTLVLLLVSALAARGEHVAPVVGGAERWALVFGVDDPDPGVGGLTDAEASARELAGRLAEAGFHHVTWRTGEDAATDDVQGWLAALHGRLGPDDTVLVAGVTHGTLCDAPVAGAQHLRLHGVTDGPSCYVGGMTDVALVQGLRDTQAGTRLLVLDACMTPFGALGGPTAPARDPLAGHVDDEVVFRSTARGLSAFQRDGRVLYTRLLARALTRDDGVFVADLDADGAVSVDELQRHLQAALAERRLTEPGLLQLPTLGVLGARQGADILVAGERGAPQRAVLTWLRAPRPPGAALTPLGPSSLLPWTGGRLEQRDRAGVAARVLDVPARPGVRDGRALVAGRRRGAPSLRLLAGGGGALTEPAPLAAPSPWLVGGALTAHPLPELALTVGGFGNDRFGAAWLAVDAALHWRRLTATAGPRLSALVFTTAEEVVARRVGLGVGGGLGARVGLGGPLAWTVDAAVDLTGRRVDGRPARPLAVATLTSGLMIDLGLLR